MANSQHIIQAVLSNNWAMLPTKLDEITEFLEMRAQGITVEASDIKQAMAEQAASSFAALVAEQEDEGKPIIQDGVQVMQLFGTLGPRMNLMMNFSGGTSTQQFAYDIGQAAANDKIKTALVEVDSPGGVVAGTEESRLAIKQAREAGLRVVVVGRNLMASAAYYIGASASYLVATPSTETGSLGVYAIVRNVAKAMEDSGIKFTVFRAGALKAADNPYEELTPERRAALQARVDGPYEMFVNAVAEDRNTTPERVKAEFGQGTVFLAEEAKSRGMIDEVALIDDVFEAERSRNRVAASTTFRAAPAAQLKESDMNARIKAALFARELIDAQDTEDSVCQVALKAWFKSRGEDVPQTDDAILKAMNEAPEKKLDTTPVSPPAENVAKAHEQEMAEAKAEAVAANQARIADIQASGEAFKVDAETIKAAIADPNMSHEEFIKSVRDKMPIEQPPVVKVEPLEAGRDLWASDAEDALMFRLADINSKPQLSDRARQLNRLPLNILAKHSLLQCGQKVSDYDTDEEIVERAMNMGGEYRMQMHSAADGFAPQASNVPYNQPGSFPHLLSNLANKFLDSAIELAEPSYPDWTAVIPQGLRDFKPTAIPAKGVADGMDEVVGAEDIKDIGLEEELLSYLFLRRFANKFGWTVEMIANDDLGAFQENMIGLAQGWEFTVNDLCLNLLTANGALLDAVALYAAATTRGGAAGNTRASGAAPQDSEWAAMETQYADITGIGTTRRVRGSLNTILCPSGTPAQGARRTFMTYPTVEQKLPITDATVGLYRGQVRVSVEPELRGSSTTIYYGFYNPTSLPTATVVRAYFRNYGQRGRREQWYEPRNKTTWVSLEGRIGAAVKNWRYTIRNNGA